ncbi:MAG TPA: hypothetical protein VMU51_01685 [Mycobacteriales bacterium]|nr:hypothetical protein [Mycobacteriales bacterium]
MTTTPPRRCLTVGELRSLLAAIPSDVPLLVGIRDRHHVNTLLGDLAVLRASIMPSGPCRALVLDVDTVS